MTARFVGSLIAATIAGLILGLVLTRKVQFPSAQRIACAVKDLGGTGSVTVLCGILAFLAINGAVLLGAAASVFYELLAGTSLDPSAFWERTLDTMLIAAGAFAGVGVLGKVGQRATTKPEVIRAEAEADTIRAQTGEYRAAPAATAVTPVDGRTLATDDPRRGLDDEGKPL